MGFRRRHRVSLKPFDKTALPKLEPISLEDAIDEGLMLAEYASRMLLKNHIEVTVLTVDRPYDGADFLDAAAQSLDALATEARGAADRVSEERDGAASMSGLAEHLHDYRVVDVANLERRRAVSVEVADRLQERRRDREYLLRLIERARAVAWEEIGSAIEDSLERRRIPVDEDYLRHRDQRMRLIGDDLDRLSADSRD
ncbi:MAG: hypothetical protein ABI255_11580 [Microbacteriaceae bacterium]